MKDEILEPKEVAEILKVSTSKLKYWRRKDSTHSGPDYFMVGNAVRYKQSAVDAYIKKQEDDALAMMKQKKEECAKEKAKN